MRPYPYALRVSRHQGLTAAISALAVFGLSVGTVKLAHAEFQIQEATSEKGETEFEYRGAYHWGVPEATENNENANDLVQSHEFELEHAFINWWLMQFTLGTEQPLHEDFNLIDVEIESEFGLIKRKGDGIALSFQVGQAINRGRWPAEDGILVECRRPVRVDGCHLRHRTEISRFAVFLADAFPSTRVWAYGLRKRAAGRVFGLDDALAAPPSDPAPW